MPLYTFRLISCNDSPGPRVGTAVSREAAPPLLPRRPPAPSTDHVRDDVLPGLVLGLRRAVQLAQDEDAQLLALQQPPHLLHVEPADALAVQHAVHHLLQELLVLTGGVVHTPLLGSAAPWQSIPHFHQTRCLPPGGKNTKPLSKALRRPPLRSPPLQTAGWAQGPSSGPTLLHTTSDGCLKGAESEWEGIPPLSLSSVPLMFGTGITTSI